MEIVRFHINHELKVMKCSADNEASCRFYGLWDSSNHYDDETFANREVENILSKAVNPLKGTANTGKIKETILNELNDYSLRKVKARLQSIEVNSVDEIVKKWFNGNRENYETFMKLAKNKIPEFSPVRPQVAKMLLDGFRVTAMTSNTNTTEKESDYFSTISIIPDGERLDFSSFDFSHLLRSSN